MVNNSSNYVIYLFVYVNDIIITGSYDEIVEGVIAKLSGELPFVYLANYHFFLGIQAKRSREGLHPNQSQFLANLFKSCDLDNLKYASTSMVTNKDLHSDEFQIDDVK